MKITITGSSGILKIESKTYDPQPIAFNFLSSSYLIS